MAVVQFIISIIVFVCSAARAMATIFVLGCTKREANTITAEQIKTMIEMMN
jgi:hypothetical protein